MMQRNFWVNDNKIQELQGLCIYLTVWKKSVILKEWIYFLREMSAEKGKQNYNSLHEL